MRLTATLRLTFKLAGLRLSVATAIVGTFFIAEVVALHRVLRIERLCARQVPLEFAALAHLLFAIGQDNAIIMLGVLQIVLGENPVAG